MLHKEDVSMKPLGKLTATTCAKKKKGKKEVGTGACLPPSYITFLLPTLTNSLGTGDSKCRFSLIPAGLITAVSLWSEGLCRLVL